MHRESFVMITVDHDLEEGGGGGGGVRVVRAVSAIKNICCVWFLGPQDKLYWIFASVGERSVCSCVSSVISICGFEDMERSPPRTQSIHLRLGEGSRFM